MNSFKGYLLATLLSFVFGAIYNVIIGLIKGVDELIKLSVLASLIATIIIAIINLLYFLPVKNIKIKYITPGLIIVMVFYLYWSKSIYDLLLFLPIALVNLGVGVFVWYKKEKAR